jgi:hypothetical protein
MPISFFERKLVNPESLRSNGISENCISFMSNGFLD